ncbi:quinol:cytochrome C oxidoreductase [Blastopirellula marina]|uniref:Quinol:cytochrome C oxidoreductase n=1 Tax=Blastopirellula marina TaxID=124 RepID=A0A2S8GC46_9BACT|nr:quinol:cytochrome C oxidoreductase [Blastopirellula marina]PQO41999.1 quinol:cytochrome C oxidoreductase [Blastopirellula marina]
MGGHHQPTITVTDDDSIRISPAWQSLRIVFLLGGVGLLLLAGVLGYSSDPSYFFHSYLTSFVYFLSISLGALFFVPVHFLARAGWNVVVRRVAELMMQAVIPLALLFVAILVPVLLGSDALFTWNNPALTTQGSPDYDQLIAHKTPYLNWSFFAFRAVFYFGAWIFIARYFYNNSLKQDGTGDKKITLNLQKNSALAVIAFALTVTFASFDWLMSLDPHWFSTIFGVYFFAGCALSFFATITIILVLLQGSGKLTGIVSKEHYHDLGKYTFGFTLFWGYIAFSQYLLIWYANIPEETEWYLRRQENGWAYVAIALLFGQFFIPFFGVMSRHVRRHKYALAGWAAFILVMHYVDLYYIIMPQVGDANGAPQFGIVDICCFLGFAGVYISSLIWFATDRPLVPLKDPRLNESLALQNH